MAFECLHTEDLLTAALAGRASEAERLLLEEHLEQCAACRERRAAFEALRRTRAWEPELSDAARDRVLRGLLAAAATPAGRRPAAAPSGGWPTVAVAAVFALAIVGLFVPAWRKAAVPRAMASGDPVAAANARDRLRPAADGTATVHGMALTLGVGAEAYWRADSRTLELRQGAALVTLAADARVVTPGFAVRGPGATVRVDPQGVTTERGVVNVRTRDDQPIADVGAGQRWGMGTGVSPVAAR
jgi:hypothetical protein